MVACALGWGAAQGSVRVGGYDVQQLQLDSLRRALGEVPQDLGEPRAGWVVAVAAARPTAWLVSEGAPSP